MTDLEALKDAIRHLSPEQYREIRQFVNQNADDIFNDALEVIPPVEEDVETRMAILNKAFADIRESMSPEELEEMIEIMNSEYVDTDDDELFGWIDDLPEDER